MSTRKIVKAMASEMERLRAEVERLRAEAEALRRDVRDARDIGDLSRCRECKRLTVRRGWCCAMCGVDPTQGDAP